MACWIQLRDTMPSWISEVNQLSVHVYNKRAEFAAEAANVVHEAPSSLHRRASFSNSSLSTNRSMPRSLRQNNRSLKRFMSSESLRSGDMKRQPRKIVSKETISETDVATSRGSAETATSGMDVTIPKTPKQIISYDGHTQKALEKMVRDIWTIKSKIRSYRISLSMRSAINGQGKMSSLKSYNNTAPEPKGTAVMEVDPVADNEDIDPLQLRMLMMKERLRRYDSPRVTPIQPPQPPPQLEKILPQPPQQQQKPRCSKCPYDFIESQLENAQNLCETAAYRFLRIGNCLEELEGIVRAYELVLEASTTLAEQEEGRMKTEQEQQADAKFEALYTTPAPAVVTAKASAENDPDELNAGMLEVDDQSETSEVSIDISAFRMTRHGYRTMQPFAVHRVR